MRLQLHQNLALCNEHNLYPAQILATDSGRNPYWASLDLGVPSGSATFWICDFGGIYFIPLSLSFLTDEMRDL